MIVKKSRLTLLFRPSTRMPINLTKELIIVLLEPGDGISWRPGGSPADVLLPKLLRGSEVLLHEENCEMNQIFYAVFVNSKV